MYQSSDVFPDVSGCTIQECLQIEGHALYFENGTFDGGTFPNLTAKPIL